MKKNLLNYYVCIVVLFSDFMMFAQPGNESDDPVDEPVEGGDELPLPINGKLMWLLIIGLLFAIYTFRNKRQEA